VQKGQEKSTTEDEAMEGPGAIKIQEIKGLDSAGNPQLVATTPKREETAKRQPHRPAEVQNAIHEVRKTSQEKIQKIAEAMDSYVHSIQRELQIQVHQKTGDIVVKVISKEDGKTIREIPPEELLNLAARMEELSGVLFNRNA
jgi:flagellar protein FlaG